MAIPLLQPAWNAGCGANGLSRFGKLEKVEGQADPRYTGLITMT
jgi:hypothetical protein